MNIAEIISELRREAGSEWSESLQHIPRTMIAAADAIEKLQAKVAMYEKEWSKLRFLPRRLT